MHFLKEGQKIRALVDPSPPIIRAMPERKRFFSVDLFPKEDEIKSNLGKYHKEWVKNEKVRMLERRRVPFPLFKHLQTK